MQRKLLLISVLNLLSWCRKTHRRSDDIPDCPSIEALDYTAPELEAMGNEQAALNDSTASAASAGTTDSAAPHSESGLYVQ